MRSRAIRIVTFVIAQTLVCHPSFGWGHEGHRIIAKIAAKNLSATARQKLAAILGTNDAGLESALADASTWPDEIDKSATQTASWHFINIAVGAPFSIAGLCPSHNCVVDRITDMQGRLAANTTGFTLPVAPVPARPMTSQELAFLVHFVGDIHQPLHAANDGDRGGNCVPLTTPLMHPDGTSTSELHAVWDVDEVIAVLAALGSEDASALALFHRFKNGTKVTQAAPMDWAKASWSLAKTAVYQKLHIPNHSAPLGQCAAGIQSVTVTQAYLAANVSTVERQLLRAGIRLSRVLNQMCAGNGCKASP